MHSILKQDMRDAGIAVSEGNELQVFDLQLARDYLHFAGYNLGDEFHKYEAAKAARNGNEVPFPVAPVDTNGEAVTAAAEAEALRLQQEQEAAKAAAEAKAAEEAQRLAQEQEAARVAAEAKAAEESQPAEEDKPVEQVEPAPEAPEDKPAKE